LVRHDAVQRVAASRAWVVVISRRGRAGAAPGGADAGDDHEDDAEAGRDAGDLPEQQQAGQQRDGRLQAHQRAEGSGGEPAQREQFQAERQHRVKQGQCQHDEEQRPGHPGQLGAAGGQHGDDASHRHGDGQPAQARDVVADVLGQQDVGGPAGRGAKDEREAGRVDPAVPGLGQQHDADRGQYRPALAPAARPV